MHVRELLTQNHHLLRGERFQTDDRRQQIPGAFFGKLSFLKPGAERLIAVDATSRVLDTLRGPAHEDAQILRLPLESVIVHGQDLLIIVVSGNRLRNLVDIHQLIHKDQHPLVAGKPEKHREQLQVLIPVVIRDDGIYPQILPCLGTGHILAAEPPDHFGADLVIVGKETAVVERDQLRKVKAVHHLAQRARHRADPALDRRVKFRSL